MNRTVTRSRPVASLSLDLDNRWAYLRAAGRNHWQTCGSYLPLAIDRIVDCLGELDLPLTVFLVGRDLVQEDDLRAIASFDRLKSWEPANHSLNHLPWMHTMDRDAIAAEIDVTHQRIETSCGRRPWGFRGPGFSCPDTVLQILASRDYAYDASSFPTSVAPLARAVFLARCGLRGEEREQAKKLYGGFASMLKPNTPHRRGVDGRTLWELPVTVMPLTRLPIHMSYLVFLASISTTAAKAYFRGVLRLCRWTATPPSLLLHPPDFMGVQDDDQLDHLPGMKMPRHEKLAFVRWALKLYAQSFDVRCMIDQLRTIGYQTPLPSSVSTVPAAS